VNTSERAPALELCDVVKDFAVGIRGVKLRALDHVSLRVESGQVYGLLGPNGSGKSTSLKVSLGILDPTFGESRIFGLQSSAAEARRQVGYLPESPCFPGHLTGRELIRFYARLCGLGGTELACRVADILELVGLHEATERRVRSYSKGMLQRIGFAQALVHDPRLVILDEPTAGVDPAGSMMICELILKLKGLGKTVVITSHLLPQLEEICDACAILDQGRVVFEGELDDPVSHDQCNRSRAVLVETSTAEELADLRGWLTDRGRLHHLTSTPRSRLEQIYVERVGKRGDL
jgi:ABC-2 type transport system ATP-binding protein